MDYAEDYLQQLDGGQQRVRLELPPPPLPPDQGSSDGVAGALLNEQPYLSPAAVGGGSGAVLGAYNIYAMEDNVFSGLSPNPCESFKRICLSPSPRVCMVLVAEFDGVPLFDDSTAAATASQAEDKHTSPAASGAHTRVHTHI